MVAPVKTERATGAEAADFPIAEPRALRFARIFHQRNLSIADDALQPADVGGKADHMSDENTPGSGRDLPFDLAVVHSEISHIRVYEHRRQPALHHRCNRRWPRHRRHDDLVGRLPALQFFEGVHQQKIRRASRIDEDGVPRALPLGKGPLELLHFRELREPCRVLDEINERLEIRRTDDVFLKPPEHQRSPIASHGLVSSVSERRYQSYASWMP